MGKDWKEHLKPVSYADYISIGPVLVYRWVWMLLLSLLFCGVIAAAGLPLLLQGEGETLAVDAGVNAENAPLFDWDAPALAAYTGLARIRDAAGVVRFAGEVKEGACTGRGTVFNAGGMPVYVGELLDNQYEGRGKQLDLETKIISEGEFVAGAFTGKGKQFWGTALLREGTFQDGQLNGEGKLFSPEGEVLYEGMFLAGAFQGEGKLLDPETKIISEGEFAAGAFTGKGRQLVGERLLREGMFEEGRLSGMGTEYAPDNETREMIAAVTGLLGKGAGGKPPETAPASAAEASPERASGGEVRLEGSFSKGKLEDAGWVYVGDALLYIGAFHEGKFQGVGTLHDLETGRVRYEGGFQKGLPSGKGELYGSWGQHYYSGAVYQGEIDALSFLGASLALVEAAFPIHPLIYTIGEKTAFVYPAQKLAFLTDSPVELADPFAFSDMSDAESTTGEESGGITPESGMLDAESTTGEESGGIAPESGAADAESTTGEESGGIMPESGMLDAESTIEEIIIGIMPESGAADAESTTGEESGGIMPESGAADAESTTEKESGGNAEPMPGKIAFSDKTRPEEIQITQIILALEQYPGLPGEAYYLPDEETPPEGADYFAMDMLGAAPFGYEKKQTGEYRTVFAACGKPAARQRETALQDGLLVARCAIKDGRYYLVSRKQP